MGHIILNIKMQSPSKNYSRAGILSGISNFLEFQKPDYETQVVLYKRNGYPEVYVDFDGEIILSDCKPNYVYTLERY